MYTEISKIIVKLICKRIEFPVACFVYNSTGET